MLSIFSNAQNPALWPNGIRLGVQAQPASPFDGQVYFDGENLFLRDEGNSLWKNLSQASGSIITSTVVTATDPDFSSLNNIELLPAPGVGKTYDILSVSATTNITTAYSLDTGFQIFLSTTAITGFQTFELNTINSRFYKWDITNHTVDSANRALLFQPGSPSSAGAGTMTFYVLYRIIDF